MSGSVYQRSEISMGGFKTKMFVWPPSVQRDIVPNETKDGSEWDKGAGSSLGSQDGGNGALDVKRSWVYIYLQQ